MSETNVALIGAFVTAVASIAASIFSAWISRKSSLQLKSTDLFFSAKLKSYNQFLTAASSLKEIDQPLSYEQLNEIHKTAAQLSLFCSTETQIAVKTYCCLLYKNSSSEDDILAISKAYANVIASLKRDLEKYDYNNQKGNRLSRDQLVLRSFCNSRNRKNQAQNTQNE